MTVLILGDYEDHHALHMLEQVRAADVPCHMTDSRWYPGEMSLWYDPLSEQGEFHLPEVVIPFSEIRSVYWRSYHGVFPPNLPNPQQSFIAENDARSLLESILMRLPAHWVNGWSAYRLHQTKPAQLAMVAKLGVTVPPTLLTNEPGAATAFAQQHGQAIFKPVQGGAHTQRLQQEHLTEQALAHLALAPITLQQEVPGTNIRVFVIGSRVLACEIATGAIDFRDDDQPRIEPHDLPQVLQTQCRAIAKCLHLRFTGIDFRLTPTGEYLFLEANPSPMFLGFEAEAGLPITECLLAELLQSGE